MIRIENVTKIYRTGSVEVAGEAGAHERHGGAESGEGSERATQAPEGLERVDLPTRQGPGEKGRHDGLVGEGVVDLVLGSRQALQCAPRELERLVCDRLRSGGRKP